MSRVGPERALRGARAWQHLGARAWQHFICDNLHSICLVKQLAEHPGTPDIENVACYRHCVSDTVTDMGPPLTMRFLVGMVACALV